MTCHSINYDPRTKQIVVSDRENHRHQWFDFDVDSLASLPTAIRQQRLHLETPRTPVTCASGMGSLMATTTPLCLTWLGQSVFSTRQPIGV